MAGRWLVRIALLVGTLCLAGCAGLATPLSGSQWQLATLRGQDLIEGTVITLAFDRTEARGSAGCNTYGGSYASDRESLSFQDLYATEMGCLEPEGVLEQEQRYLAALGVAAGYRIENGQLTVFDTTGTELLVFDATNGR